MTSRDALQRDALQRDDLQRDALQIDDLQRDALQRDALQRGALQRDDPSVGRAPLLVPVVPPAGRDRGGCSSPPLGPLRRSPPPPQPRPDACPQVLVDGGVAGRRASIPEPCYRSPGPVTQWSVGGVEAPAETPLVVCEP